MNEMEKMLAEEKKRLDQLRAPDELEERLRQALQNTKPQQRNRSWSLWISIAAAAFLFIMVSYNYNAVAYYGKKLLGFDEVMTDTLQQLNEQGMGQIIDKTYSLGNGMNITIDAVMTDESRMIVYYTVSDPKGTLYDTFSDVFRPSRITGWFTNSHHQGGAGVFNEARTELKGTMDFDPPSPFAKKLTLHYWSRAGIGKDNQGKLTFPYDPNKALQTQLTQSLNEKVKVDKGTINFKELTAAPTQTVITGKLDVDNFDRVNHSLGGVDLMVNGETIEMLGSGSSTSGTKGTTFELRYDALPAQIESLEIRVSEFVGYEKLDQVIDLSRNDLGESKLGKESLVIENITKSETETRITIVTEDDVLLDDVNIQTEQGRIPLKTTIGQTLEKEQGKILKRRTIVFSTKDKPEKLIIGGIHYMKKYDKKIEIEVK